MSDLYRHHIDQNADALEEISSENLVLAQEEIEHNPELLQDIFTEFVDLYNKLLATPLKTNNIILFKHLAGNLDPEISSANEFNKIKATYKAMDRLVSLGLEGAKVTSNEINRAFADKETYIESLSKPLPVLGLIVASAAHAFEGYLKNIGIVDFRKDDFIHAVRELIILSGSVNANSVVVTGFREAGWLEPKPERVKEWREQHDLNSQNKN